MIKIKGARNYLVSLESVAMTDIVLNMFIFFFLSFSLLYTFNPERMSKVEVNLPSSRSAVSMRGEEKVVIAIAKDGRVYLQDRHVSVKSLKEELGSRLKKDPSLGIVLRVDRQSRFAGVVGVLDVINELGIKRVSVAAVKSGYEGKVKSQK